MKNFAALTIVLFFTTFAFGQTPCPGISPLDCEQINASLPVSLNFDGTDSGILGTGFTMVDAPSSPLPDDELINDDDDVPGLISTNLELNGGALNVTATNGINFSQLSNSTFTNSQMNALGVGFIAGSNIIDVSGTIDQPDFAGTTNNNATGSQQAGIWFGLNENNFAKLVVVKASSTQQKVQLAIEQGDGIGNTTNLVINELNTDNFSLAGISTISFRISVDPSNNSVQGFYSTNGGAEIQVGGSDAFLTAPQKFIDGVDHDANIGTDALTYAGIMTSTRRATGGSMIISYDSFGVSETTPTPPAFEAHINFMSNQIGNNSGDVIDPPTGYVKDFGQAFGTNQLSNGSNYGWKNAQAPFSPLDISHLASNNSNGAGRNRLGNGYVTATDEEKLEGTLVHFQGNDIKANDGTSGWAGEPRGNEAIWEVEVPNGTYSVTISLGDEGSDIDSRHSAAVEGYTVVPAFIPAPSENRNETIVVSVEDGLLTISGIGGYNSKINYIDILESTDTPVNGVLSFTPATTSESLEVGTTGTIASNLSSSGAVDGPIGIVIDDNFPPAGNKIATGTNDWLTIPASATLGDVDFDISAANLAVADTRSNTIIATAKGFAPAILDADLTVTEAPIVPIATPFRMNVAGAEYTKDADLYQAEDVSYLVETQSTTVSTTSYEPYLVPGGHTALYYPRRYGPEFSYNFPIANGTYTVSLHMVENFQTTSGARIFDVSIEEDLVIDDLDLFANYGKGGLAVLSFDVLVADEELNIDFLASVNNAIVQAIEILPVATSDATEILTFSFIEETAPASIDTEAGTVSVEVENGTDLTSLAPTISVSDGATITPISGIAQDFDAGPVTYTVTAEDGVTTKEYAVTVSEAPEPFAAFINFQNNPSSTTPPAGYVPDYGKEFGNASITVNSTNYAYGWKLLATDAPWDASEEVSGNSTGVGRMRLANIDAYNAAGLQEKLEGTLVHFQGDNIASWTDGQPRKNELYWELEVPNGTYEVTLGLGDKASGNVDSRHTATLEGYTIIPAFIPNDSETRVSTMIVEVTDGALTMNGLGGFNSKITHIEVAESNGSPVTGVLAFAPNTVSESIAAGTSGSFASTLSGDGATAISLNIEDDPVNATADNFNDWLSLPATDLPGEFTFGIDASTLIATDTRSNRIIATAAGFTPAILDADLTVTEGAPVTFTITDEFDSYTVGGNLHEEAIGVWEKEGTNDAAIPILGAGFTSGTTNALDFSNGPHTHDFLSVENVILPDSEPFYFGTYFQVTSVGSSPTSNDRIRVALRIDDEIAGDQWVRQQIANGLEGIIARIGLGGPASDNGQSSIEPDQVLQFVVKGEWDGASTITYSYSIDPKINERDTQWLPAGTHTVQGVPQIGRLFISSAGNNDGKVGPIRLSTDYTSVVTEEILGAPSPCSPFSTLPCDQIVNQTPVDFSFDGTQGGLSDTGFTMVDPYSGTRVPEDGTPSNIGVPGYEPGNLALTNNNLVITSNKGIAYLDNNAQINSLGVGLQNITAPITIETKLLGITTGGSAAQAGLWFGLDDENFVKLNVNDGNIEMRREIGGLSANGTDTPDQIQVASAASGEDVTLRLIVDPQAFTLTAFYSFDDTNFIQLVKTGFDNLQLPLNYLTGKEINGEVSNASFAGVYATHRNNANSFDATFDYFTISEEAALSFDVTELNFSAETGEIIAPQTATLTASEGNPAIILSDDPDSGSWLILPENPVIGDIEFGIQEGLAPGTYSTTVFAIDQPDLGYSNAAIQINLEVSDPVNDFAVNINFSDPDTTPPANYESDGGDAFGDRGNGLNYGWLDATTDAPADLTLNGRNRGVSGVDLLENTLIHMQYGDVSTNAANGYLPDAKWEIEVPNGSYLVTVFVGDPNVDGSVEDTPRHRINAEGVNIIDDFSPTGTEGSSTRFTSGSATVTVGDGRLTLDPSGFDGWNTKITSVQIVASEGGIQTPRVVGVFPVDGAIGVSVNTSVSANDLFLPNLDAQNNAGVDNTTITTNTVKLIKVENGNQVLASVNGTGGGDAINLVPAAPLESNTEYRFEINGVLDLVGEPFEAFTSTFTTGGGTTGPITDLDNVSFTNGGAVASGAKYSTLTIGPDGKLYGLQINGDIDRWTIENDGTLSNKEDLDTWKANYNNNRTSVGLTFDPDATAQNLIAYISHNSGGLNGAPAWDGKISRLTGENLEIEDLIVTNLPRSTKDHLTNSITFKPGENNVLYFNQGSNSAAGAPDNSWGQRKERLLSAAALRLDLDKLPEGSWPLNAKTTMDQATINGADVNSPTLASPPGTVYSESGQSNIPDDGTYNPYYINAPLTLYGTGIRNAYDLVWHSNGQLYIPTNGTAGGSNAPASVDDTRRPDGSFYDHDVPGTYPVIPASNGNNTQRDWLFRLNPANPLGYYGHPNPLRGEFVLNRGDADVDNSVYDGITSDINYRGAAFDFEFNKSPNGVIEYKSNAENGNLTGALLVVRYSGGSDIIALVPDGPNGDIQTFKEGIPGFTGFGDPLDLVEDVSTGNIYVSDYGRSEIVLLRPSAQAAPEAVIVVDTDGVVGDAITNNDFTQEILLSNLGNATLQGITVEITGPDADQFQVSGVPTSLNAQNSDAFNVIFTPTSVGPKFAQLTVSGTDVDPVVIPMNGLGKQGTGGSNEPSLQWILDTQLGSGAVDVGDEDPSTNIFDPVSGSDYNSLLGEELDIQSFERAVDAPVTLELLSVYGPTANNPIVAFGWYETGNASATNELFVVDNSSTSNGQSLNPPLTGLNQFDPGNQSFGFYSRWPFFDNRQLFSEDALNTFSGAIPHHVRVYAMPGETDAYIIATEEHVSGFDYQDIVVVARNLRPADETPDLYCSPISLLACEEIPVSLPLSLDFDGSEGGLSNTGFTMVDNPSVRLTADLPITYPDVLGYEPDRISLSNGNLILEANNGIAFRTEGPNTNQSTEVNSQVNTLGVGFDADSYGNFSIATTIVDPYTDGANNSEQAGIWFGLNEDNFVKLVANANGQVELRSELNGISDDVNQQLVGVAGLNSSTVQLRLFVDVENNLLVPFYSLNDGPEIGFDPLPLPLEYLAGNPSYDNQSFAGIFGTKRREETAAVSYTFEDFSITPESIIAFNPIRINFSRAEDTPPTGYLQDSGLGFGDRVNEYSYGWLTVDGQTPLDLTGNTRNREVAGIDLLNNTLIHMQYGNAGGTNGNLTEGIWEVEVPNGTYTVSVGVGDPEVDGTAGTEPFHTINAEGVNIIDRYSPTGVEGAATRFTSGSASVEVTDGRLTIDAQGGFNTKINSLQITQDAVGSGAFFSNVNPEDNSTNVATTGFQITVSVNTPEGYELDKATIAGNVNLYRVSGNDEILVPSNSNDTGGGDAITLTPLSELQTNTDYTFRLTSDIEANLIGDLTDRIPFQAFSSEFTTGDGTVVPDLDLTGVAFTRVALPSTQGERFSSLVIGPDGKLYGSTIGDFQSDGRIFRWDMAADGTLENQEILTPELVGSPDPEGGTRPSNNNERLIIGFAFDPAATAENLIAYVTHSQASDSDGPEWDGKLTRLSGPNLSEVQDIIVHLPRSKKDHLTNSIIFNEEGDMFINQGSNSAGGAPDAAWDFRPERLLSAAILKLELDKLPGTLPLSAYTTDDISVINAAPSGSITMSDNTYNPYAVNSPLTIYASGIRNAYDFVWHTNGWMYIPTNGTAGNNSTSPNSPSYTIGDPLARRIDGLTSLPNIPALNGGETQKDWLFKTQGGSYHGHPNPFRGEFVLNHGGAPYSGVPGQETEPATDVDKYPNTLGPDPNYREPAYDFGFNKSPNGVIEYQSDAFEGRLQGLLMVVRFSGQDDIIVLQPQGNGDIANANGDVPGLQGFDDPLDIVEDPKTGNLYVSEYDRGGNTNVGLVLLRANVQATQGPEIVAAPEELIFEVTENNEGDQTDTKIVEITNDGNEVLNITGASFTGPFADQFVSVTPSGQATIQPGESLEYSVEYAAGLDDSALGHQEAALVIESDDPNNPSFEIGLHGLKKAGYEGGQEPPLQDVVDALGIGIDVGWDGLANGTSAVPQGEELGDELWIKSGSEPVTLVSVGRYSPAETLPFGWYTNDGTNITTNEVGVQAGGIDNAQTLFPVLESGSTSFDPQGAVFGIYVESNSFGRFNYTEDAINTGGVAHRTRVYPNKDRDGNLIPNSYLVTFEDASNGDYQDYIYLLSNVEPFVDGSLVLDFNKDNLSFIASLNQETIPVQQISLSGTGGVVSSEITLQSSEDWLVLPESFDLNSPFDIGIDNTGLGNGSYTATVTASSPNYEEATFEVNLEITNELVYTYQFNFQDPTDIETSPEGYIDDIGTPFGVQSTILGNLAYGWVLPGTSTPADASANGRNRNTGTNDDALLKTFTIIGHRTAADYPLLDWMVEVPNGTYAVNISVGDPDYSDSNHVLDVNGINVLDYDQESIVPETFESFENTEFVDVVDGTLRLSLGAGGVNTKPNYIRLAPLDASLLPPTILASFDGIQSDVDTYRGSVDISLEAQDQSDSGSIARLEYNLDDSGVETYVAPVTVSEVGPHVLVVTAEDANGNITEETFNFTIEASTGAILAIENMTKIPGTNRSFPADDYLTFHNVGDRDSRPTAGIFDTNTMRVRNNGTGVLVIEDITLPSVNNFEFEIYDETQALLTEFPIAVQPEEFIDVQIKFIRASGGRGTYEEEIVIVSNADNALESSATLNGAYQTAYEGNSEITAQEVIDAFGFQTSMLSIVNDEGTIDPPNPNPNRPSSNFPTAENIELGYEGDLIYTDAFVQADPSQPVIGIQLSALHGPGEADAELLQAGGNNRVGDINFAHNGNWYQTLLPRSSTDLSVMNFDVANTIAVPFRIVIGNNYPSDGGNNINNRRPDLLGTRVYKVIDRDGNIVPNEYIVVQDYIGDGCGAGSANCDWNDNTFYFINIRPEGVPTAQPIEDLLVNLGEEFNLDLSDNFDSGYAGNSLTYGITGTEGGLPNWLQINPQTGILSGTPPVDAPSNLEVNIEATGLNGLVASTTLNISVNLPPVAQDDEVTLFQNVVTLLDGLLTNDSDPNSQSFSITSVETPLNGQAEIQEGGAAIIYTPDFDYVGNDSFSYTIEDETGLSASANVSLTIAPENQAPVAVLESNIESGQAALLVDFTGSNSIDENPESLTYEWNFGDSIGTSTDANPSYTFTSSGQYTVSLVVTDFEGLFDIATKVITVSAPANTAPTAVASITPLSGPNSLTFNFDAGASSDAESGLSYLWDFGDGTTSTEEVASHTYDSPGLYEVSLTVTDSGSLTNSVTSQIEAKEPVEGDVVLRINAGGPAVSYEGNEYVSDQNFVGGKVYENASAEVPVLYQTERSASPPEFGYEIPLENGEYEVTLHFAEIYWNATGGGTGGVGSRIFDVVINGETVLDDFDIIAQAGSQTVTTRTFPVTISNGILEINFDALGDDGVDQPKLSAIEIFGSVANTAPNAIAAATPLSGTAPLEVAFDGSGSSDAEGPLAYSWDFGNGDTSDQESPSYTYTEPGTFLAVLTITDQDGETDEASVTIEVEPEVVVGCGPVPSPWANSDIGAVGAAGEACFDSGTFEVSASGADIWNSADEFHYVYRELAGDGEIIARVVSLDQTNPWAKAAVMMRNGLDADAALAMTVIAPNPNNIGGPGYSLQHRTVEGATMGDTSFSAPTLAPGGFPQYIRLVRSGDTFTGYVSETNGNWTLVGTVDVAMDETIFVGLATTSHNDGVLANALYDNVEIIGNGVANTAPNAIAAATPLSGTAPLEVAFDGSGSSDAEGPLAYSWDFGNGDTSDQESPSYTYTEPGTFLAVLTITDQDGETDEASVTIEVEPEVVVGCGPVPAPWANSDIGAVGAAGKACFDNGTFEVSASGADIWNSADEFHYVYRELAGDGEIIARVVSLDQTNPWAKAAVMMRNGLDADAALAMTVIAPNPNNIGGPGYSLQHRTVEGATMGDTSFSAPTLAPGGFPQYIRLVRSGDTFTGYVSETNGNWTLVGTVDVAMDETIFVGLATTSHNDGVLANALYDNVEIIGNGVANTAPNAIAAATPLSGTAPLEVAFDGSGSSDAEGPLAYSWDFGNGDTSDQESPSYTYTEPGTFLAVLTITDQDGETDEASVTIEVEPEVVVGCGPVPAPWANSDIGAVGAAGKACFDNGTFEVSASGADIWNSADEFHYVYRELAGDGEIIARVVSLDQTNPWAKAAVMMRNGLDADAALAMTVIAPNPNNIGGPGYSLQHRTVEGATMGDTSFSAPTLAPGGFPQYIRLVRSGDTFTGYVSETNGNWTLVGTVDVAMDETIFVGLATTSHNDGVLANALYDNVEVTQGLQLQTTTFPQGVSNKFSVSPNPSSVETSLSFELPTMIETIYIHNMSGSLIKTIKGGLVDDKGTPLNIQELPVGVYIIIAKDKNGREYQQKLLVDPR